MNAQLLTKNDNTNIESLKKDVFHATLAEYNRKKLSPSLPSSFENVVQNIFTQAKLNQTEVEFLFSERKKISAIAAQCPDNADEFIEWFEQLKQDGPGQYDPLFTWLAEEADYEQMRWFIRQEVVGEAGFDDLLALTQLNMPTLPKLEMSRNLWDEMGAGKERGMHGPMLGHLAQYFSISEIKDMVWQAQALGNLMIGLAANRCFAYHSVGCLGAVELTAPSRCVEVVKGLKRLGIPDDASLYYRLHALIDVRHSQDWNREVIYHLVAENPSVAPHIAEGALMRLNAGARTFDCYRHYFGLDPVIAHIS